MNNIRWIVGGVSLLAALSVGALAAAHRHGQEAHTEAQCNRLPGGSVTGERGACLRCINHAGYHYHPNQPRDERCHAARGH